MGNATTSRKESYWGRDLSYTTSFMKHSPQILAHIEIERDRIRDPYVTAAQSASQGL